MLLIPRANFWRVQALTGIAAGSILLASSLMGHPVSAATPSAYQSSVLSDGPAAYWRLGETSGTTAADASGQNHTATLNGAVKLGTVGALVNDANTAMTFDGSTTSVRSNTTVAVGPDFSMEAWTKASTSTSFGTIASVYANGQVRTLYLNGRQFVGLTDIGANWPANAVSSADLDPSLWHHVVFTIQGGSSLKLYVDGALAGSTTAPIAASFSANPVIGWSDATWVSHFNGTIDDVAMYPSALSAANVSAHFAASGQTGTPPVLPTATPVPVTATPVPPIPTSVPPTATAVPPTPTLVPPPPSCNGTLQQLINAAAPGSTVSAPACLYRESVTINKPLTLAGQPGAEIRGSDVWSAWSQTGSYWISQQTVPPLPHTDNTDQKCAEPTLRCLIPEQVFVDGRALYPVGTGPLPATGQFALDAARHVILADNPAGHLLEVSTRNRWVITGADNVTIQGFTMRHSGNDAQTGAVSNDNYSSWTLQDNVLSDAHGGDLSVSNATNLKVLRNDVSRGGNLGVAGWSFTNSLIQGNHLHDNGTDLFNRNWSVGGLKMSHVQAVTVDANESDHNGDGIWCDEGCNNVTFSANRVHDNFLVGILFEISNGAVFHDNVAWNNGWSPSGWVWGAGILISSSANTEIYNNTLAWNRAGISVVDQNRPKPAAPWGHYVHDNTMIRTQQAGADFWANVTLAWTDDNGTGPGTMFDPASNNHGANNAYWEDQPEDAFNIARYAWYDGMGALSRFIQTPGDVGGHYISTAQKDQILAAKGMPSSPPVPVMN
jgi:parallel beta-helix repeat protein